MKTFQQDIEKTGSRCESGFTLIELMITVAIVAILASVALPAYQKYTIRARVAEGLGLASTAKLNIADVAVNGKHDGNGYAMGYTGPTATDNIDSVNIAPDTGVITIVLSDAAGGGTASEEEIFLTPNLVALTVTAGTPAVFVPPTQNIIWVCSTSLADTGLVPPECRNTP